MATRSFHLGDILSVTTGRLVSPNHMDGVHELLDFMTGDNLFTHQLPRANDECKPEILRQHPDLAEVPVPAEFRDEAHVWQWLAEQVARFGEYRDLEPMPAEDHTHINPFDELAMIAPHARVIGVVLPEDGAR